MSLKMKKITIENNYRIFVLKNTLAIFSRQSKMLYIRPQLLRSHQRRLSEKYVHAYVWHVITAAV